VMRVRHRVCEVLYGDYAEIADVESISVSIPISTSILISVPHGCRTVREEIERKGRQ
jgi:hypothetical protein